MPKKTIINWTIVSLVILGFIIITMVLLTPAKKKEPQVDYVAEYNRISKPADFDPNDNAAPYFDKAFELLVEEPNDLKGLQKTWPGDMNDEQLKIARQWIESNRESLELLRQAISKKYYWKPIEANDFENMPLDINVSKFRNSIYLLCLDTKLMAFNGQIEPALNQAIEIYNAGTFLAGPKFLINQLVGIATGTLAVNSSFEIIEHTNPSSVLLKNFQNQIIRLSSRNPFLVNFSAEKLLFYDEAQRKFSDSRKFKPSDNAWFTRKDSLLNLKYFFLSTKIGGFFLEREKHQVEMMYDYFDTVKLKSPWQLHNEGIDIETSANKAIKDSLTLHILIPPMSRVIWISYRAPAFTDALSTTTAVLRYKEEKGKYPQNLQTLVTDGYLAELPIDPFSGNPLVYKVTDNNFILYSVAGNFKDDGGKHDPRWADEGDGDYVFWPVQHSEKEKEK